MEYHRHIDQQAWQLAPDAREKWCRWMREGFLDDDRLLLVAETNRELVGFVHGTLTNTPPPIEDRWRVSVSGLVVRADHRRLGIGRQLMDAIIDGFADRGPEEVKLIVAVGNEAATAFYEALGFEPLTIGMRRALK